MRVLMQSMIVLAIAAAVVGATAPQIGHGRRILPATISAAVPAAAPVPVSPAPVSHAPVSAAARMFEPGRWELRPRDGGVAQQLCVVDIDRLLRLRHEAVSNCEQFALKAPPGQTTVQYTCRGRGYGRTHLRFETARLIQFDTQGVLDGIPFEMSAEARRIGNCAS